MKRPLTIILFLVLRTLEHIIAIYLVSNRINKSSFTQGLFFFYNAYPFTVPTLLSYEMRENSVLVSSIPDISSNNFKLEDMLLKPNEIINFDFNTFLVILNACDAVLSNTKDAPIWFFVMYIPNVADF